MMLTDDELAEIRDRCCDHLLTDGDDRYHSDRTRFAVDSADDVQALLTHIDEMAAGSYFMAHSFDAWYELRGEMRKRTGCDDPREWAEWVRLMHDPNVVLIRLPLPKVEAVGE